MSNIYGGDEVNSLVIDLGSCLCKVGYGGDDAPKAFFPSAVGVRPDTSMTDGPAAAADQKPSRKLSVGDQALNFRQDGMEIVSPFGEDGIVNDWELAEALYAFGFKDRLSIAPEEFAVLAAEPTHSGGPGPAMRAARERHAELLFEKFGVPAAFLSKAAVLASFATARQTSVVVDIGHNATTVAAVQDGYVLNKSVVRVPLAGQLANACLRGAVEGRGMRIRPRYSFKRRETPGRPGEFKIEDLNLPGTTASYRDYQINEVAAEIKHSVARTSDTRLVDTENTMVTVTYELPDGQEFQAGVDRFKIPELFFQPELRKTYYGAPHAETQIPSLQHAIMDVINRCDVDLRKELYSGVVLTGGGSLFPGPFRERLERELAELAPPTAKVKVVAPANNIERRFGVWIGGSILCSLGSFQQMWMSRKEYEEHGAALIHRKAP